MAEFEIFGQGSDEPKAGKKSKNKIIEYVKKNPFKVAVGVVVVLGVYAWIKSTKSPAETEETVALYSDGYPSLGYTTESGGGMSVDYTALADSLNQIVDNLNASVDDKITHIQSSVDSTNSQLWENVQSLGSVVNEQNESINQLVGYTEQQAYTIQRQNDIVQMMNNSMAYEGSTYETKQALHQANRNIASKYGWTFNESNYEWYDENGQLLYQSVNQPTIEVDRVQTSTGSTVKSSSSSSSSITPKSSGNSSTVVSGGGDVVYVSSSSKSSSGSSSSSSTSGATQKLTDKQMRQQINKVTAQKATAKRTASK